MTTFAFLAEKSYIPVLINFFVLSGRWPSRIENSIYFFVLEIVYVGALQILLFFSCQNMVFIRPDVKAVSICPVTLIDSAREITRKRNRWLQRQRTSTTENLPGFDSPPKSPPPPHAAPGTPCSFAKIMLDDNEEMKR